MPTIYQQNKCFPKRINMLTIKQLMAKVIVSVITITFVVIIQNIVITANDFTCRYP